MKKSVIFILIGLSTANLSPTQPAPLFSQDYSTIVFTSDRGDGNLVYIMNEAGENLYQLPSENDSITGVTCSPDGKYIATTGGFPGIKITKLADFSITTLFDSSGLIHNPSWSVDGSQIAFTLSNNEGWDIHIINVEDLTTVQLTNTPKLVEREFTWSPDTSQIAFAANDEHSMEIYVIDADGSNTIRLTANGMTNFFPDWSPDGNKIIFASQKEKEMDLYTISPDGTNLTQITGSPNVADWRPNWSPDGHKIAFDSSRDGNPEIYVMNSDGSEVKRLTHNDSNDYVECWLNNLPNPVAQQTSTPLN